MLLFFGLFLVTAGLIMLISPKILWTVTEKWKSEDETEPSAVYAWSTRFGGGLCVAIAIACFYALSL